MDIKAENYECKERVEFDYVDDAHKARIENIIHTYNDDIEAFARIMCAAVRAKADTKEKRIDTPLGPAVHIENTITGCNLCRNCLEKALLMLDDTKRNVQALMAIYDNGGK